MATFPSEHTCIFDEDGVQDQECAACDRAEWRPIAPAGNIWRAGDALVWKRVKVEGGPWSASPPDLSVRHGFESSQAAARHALGLPEERA